MAEKYFVYEGLQFQTIEAPDDTFVDGASDTTFSDAVTLESVQAALGSSIVTNLAALTAWWAGGTGDLQIAARQSVALTSALVMARDEDDSGNTQMQLHKTSFQYILPVNISAGINDLPGIAGDNGDARTRIIVKSLEVRHDNIRKYRTSTEAWSVWRRYELSEEFSQERADGSYKLFD